MKEYQHGDCVNIPWRKEDYLFVCCECGFTHRLRFAVAGKCLRMRVWDEKRLQETKMPTQIENIRKRTEKNLASVARDINSLLAIIEERGQLIDGLAREREALIEQRTSLLQEVGSLREEEEDE